MKNGSAARAMAAAHQLRAEMKGDVLLPGDDGYEPARQLWNGAVPHRPALFARPTDAGDVQLAVRAARANHLPLSVRGGGHDGFGRALRDSGLVIDLTRLRGVEVDEPERVATVGGGARSGDVVAAAATSGLAPVIGIAGAVGITGLTLGGGYSPLGGRYGYAVDNLLGAELVTADGRLVTADATRNPDLFWALRGGGGNFGVVTSMRIRLHPVRTVLAGPIIFPWSQAAQVLRGHAEIAASSPDELGIVGAIAPSPDGGSLLVVAPTWLGDPAEGERQVARLAALGTPIRNAVAEMDYRDLTAATDAQVVNGRHSVTGTRSLARLNDASIAALVAAGDTRTSAFSVVGWQYAHGAASRVPADATAFGFRTDHYQFQLIAAWDPADDAAPHQRWLRTLTEALAPHALPGGYPNLLSDEDTDQVPYAYGDNLPRLRQLKRQFDPDRVFTSTTPLPE